MYFSVTFDNQSCTFTAYRSEVNSGACAGFFVCKPSQRDLALCATFCPSTSSPKQPL